MADVLWSEAWFASSKRGIQLFAACSGSAAGLQVMGNFRVTVQRVFGSSSPSTRKPAFTLHALVVQAALNLASRQVYQKTLLRDLRPTDGLPVAAKVAR